MKISEFLKPERMVLDLEAASKSEAIETLAGKVRDAEEVTSFTDFLQAVFARETIATTGIGCGIGIPHARTDAVNRFMLVFGRSRQGVPFHTLDDKPVHFIFLLATPQDGLKQYLRLLACLSRLMKSTDFRAELNRIETADQVLDLFKRSEDEHQHAVDC